MLNSISKTSSMQAPFANTVKCQRCQPSQLLDMPDAVLLVIFVKYTSRDEKKALRMTCKATRGKLDKTMVSAKLWDPYAADRDVRYVCCWANDVWAKTLSRAGHLQTLTLHTYWRCTIQLPQKLTALHLADGAHSWDQFTSLTHVTALPVDTSVGGRSGVQKLSALRHLETKMDVGTLAALAPTLRYLEVAKYTHVHHVEQLTNSQVLIVHQGLPADWLQRHAHLPLKHLEWKQPGLSLTDSEMWKNAPPSLTSIAIHGAATFPSYALSHTVTSLQLLDVGSCDLFQVAAAFPDLTHFDYATHDDSSKSELRHVFKELDKLRSIHNLLPAWSSMTAEEFATRKLKFSVVQKERIAVSVVKSKEELLRHRHEWPSGLEWRV